MPTTILTQTVASITELKNNPMATVNAAGGEPIAILNRNEPAFYCVPPQVYAYLLSMAKSAEATQYKQEADSAVLSRLYQGDESVGLTFDGSLSREEKKAQLLALRR